MSAAVKFLTPPPGLGSVVDFVLDEVADAPGVYSLTAVEEPAKRLFLIEAARFVPSYTPVLADADAERLGLSAPEDGFVLVIAQPAEEGITLNLLAPVVVNHSTGAALQPILEQDWPIRQVLSAV